MYAMKEDGVAILEIARRLRRHRTVIERELKRNCPPRYLGLRRLQKARKAHEMAQTRLKERKRGKRGVVRLAVVRKHVVEKLKVGFSPEAISNTMQIEIGHWMHHSTIYRMVKNECKDLKPYLYEKGKKRRQRVTNRRGKFQQAALEKRSHTERPQAALDKSEIGHLEGDTIHSKRGSKSALVSLRDRKTRVHWFERVDNLEAKTVLRALIKILNRIPPDLRKTITFDRGSEFEDWVLLEKAFPGLTVYFCDAFSPHQKGSNERGNRDMRKYYPKGTNFDCVTSEQIWVAEMKINNHPMKLHGWQTPALVLEKFMAKIAA